MEKEIFYEKQKKIIIKKLCDLIATANALLSEDLSLIENTIFNNYQERIDNSLSCMGDYIADIKKIVDESKR